MTRMPVPLYPASAATVSSGAAIAPKTIFACSPEGMKGKPPNALEL